MVASLTVFLYVYLLVASCQCILFGTRDLFNISYSIELFLAYRIGISAIFTHVRNFYLTPLARAVPAIGKDKKELTHVAPNYFCRNYFWLSM